jgi:group I intron endonuclease
MPHIYKITSPSKKIYIGSTINIKRRFSRYKNLDCKNQFKLYRSFLKYSVGKHIFEIITECNLDEIYLLESYYGNLYNTLGENGLNLKLPKHSDSFKCVTKERLKYLSEKMKGNKLRNGIEPWNKGKKYIGDTSIFATRKGVKFTDEEKIKKSIDIKKVRSTLQSRLKTSLASKGGNNPMSRKVIQISTGRIFGSKSEAASFANINSATLGHYLRGRFNNTTDFKYLS